MLTRKPFLHSVCEVLCLGPPVIISFCLLVALGALLNGCGNADVQWNRLTAGTPSTPSTNQPNPNLLRATSGGGVVSGGAIKGVVSLGTPTAHASGGPIVLKNAMVKW